MPNGPWRLPCAACCHAGGPAGAFQAVDWDKALGWLQARTGADLAPEQADAVKLALTQKVAVLTGGPGCGKSFTVRSVVELARARRRRSCWPRRPAAPPSGWPS